MAGALPLPPQGTLEKLLNYDPETGDLTWRARCAEHFADTAKAKSPEHVAGIWNSNFAGKKAFTSINRSGYRRGRLDGTGYLAHRLIWKLVYGTDPDDIDHIDGDRLNNRIANLRSVTRAENLKNTRVRATSATGVPGVTFFKRTGRYHAGIGVNGRMKHIGYFGTFEEAVEARKQHEKELGYHPNHGRAA